MLCFYTQNLPLMFGHRNVDATRTTRIRAIGKYRAFYGSEYEKDVRVVVSYPDVS